MSSSSRDPSKENLAELFRASLEKNGSIRFPVFARLVENHAEGSPEFSELLCLLEHTGTQLTSAEPVKFDLECRQAWELAASSFPSRDDTNSPSDSPLFVYLREVLRVPRLLPAREQQLLNAIANDPSAEELRKEVVEAYLYQVVEIAACCRQPVGTNILDLIQAGNEGLMEAACHFDPEHGCSFRTYAAVKIHSAINNFIGVPLQR
jgi:DNA-directed RNA polymerase sigma subunit (sigma70/sigma32)